LFTLMGLTIRDLFKTICLNHKKLSLSLKILSTKVAFTKVNAMVMANKLEKFINSKVLTLKGSSKKANLPG